MGKIIHANFNSNIKLRKKTTAIIAAGGTGSRMKLDFNKIFLTVEDKPILSYTLDTFENSSLIDSIILVCNSADYELCKEITEEFQYKKIIKIVLGGSTRQESVRNSLAVVPESSEIVLVHDAARPLVTEEMIENTIDEAFKIGAASVGVTPVDTVKRVRGTSISETIDRNSLVLIQTPQAFRKEVLVAAHEQAKRNHQLVTDDCALCELMGQPVAVVQGSKSNIKLTTPEDYSLISAFLTLYGKEDDYV